MENATVFILISLPFFELDVVREEAFSFAGKGVATAAWLSTGVTLRGFYSKASKAYYYWRKEGALKTIRRIFKIVNRKPARYVQHYLEKVFDRQWNVDTAGIIKLPKESENPLHISAFPYQATGPRIFQKIMLSIGCLTDPFIFYDIGCGKGRVLLFASQYKFKRVIGIEFSEPLVRIAKNNTEQFRYKHRLITKIEVICGNAATYDFVDEDSIIFFFNPFSETIMKDVLLNIKRSVKNKKYRYIIYYNPELASLLTATGDYSLVVKEKKFSIYRLNV